MSSRSTLLHRVRRVEQTLWLVEPTGPPSAWLVCLGPIWPPLVVATARHSAVVKAATVTEHTGIVFTTHEPPDDNVEAWARESATPVGWLPRPDRTKFGAATVFALSLAWCVPYHVALMRVARKRFANVSATRFICLQGPSAGFVRDSEHATSILSLCDFDPEFAENQYRDETHSIKRAAYRLNWRLARRYYGRAYSRFEEVIAISEEDEALVRQLSPRAKVSTIPPTIDLLDRRAVLEPTKLVFVGAGARNMASIVWSLEHVLPLLRARGVTAPFVLAGRFSRQEVDQISSVIATARLDPESIPVVRDPPDVTDVLAPGSVLLAPFPRGAGVKLKCIEGMMRGCVVATNHEGARGTPLVHRKTGIVCDSASELATELTALFDGTIDAKTLAEVGRTAATRVHGPGVHDNAWRRLCEPDAP